MWIGGHLGDDATLQDDPFPTERRERFSLIVAMRWHSFLINGRVGKVRGNPLGGLLSRIAPGTASETVQRGEDAERIAASIHLAVNRAT